MSTLLDPPSTADYRYNAAAIRFRQSAPTVAGMLGMGSWWIRRQFFSHYFGQPPGWRVALRRLSGNRVLPDFACIGAIKSGTSELASELLSHPSVVAPLAKEIWNDDVESWRPYYPRAADMEQVREVTGNAVTGYFTPRLDSMTIAHAFHAKRPDARAIVVLRNPVDRAYSHYKWEVALGGRGTLEMPWFGDYAEYVRAALSFYPSASLPTACGLRVLESGIYSSAVAQWIDVFGRSRVHVVSAESLFADRDRTLREILEFLDLEPTPAPPRERVNENPLREVPKQDNESRALLADFYRPHNEQLYAVIGRDLGWDSLN